MHHAYIYEGSLSLLPALTASARTLFQFPDASDPDVHLLSLEKFNIEDVRDLASKNSLKSLSSRALFILSLGTVSFDAQQALLKLFEEPQQGVTFVVLVPPGSLMPTLRSRFVEYPEKLEEENISSAPAKKFLGSNGKDRSAQIAALLKDDEGQKERVRQFLSSLEALLHKNISKAQGRTGLEDIALVRKYLGDRSASLKMLLEHLAVALPTI